LAVLCDGVYRSANDQRGLHSSDDCCALKATVCGFKTRVDTRQDKSSMAAPPAETRRKYGGTSVGAVKGGPRITCVAPYNGRPEWWSGNSTR